MKRKTAALYDPYLDVMGGGERHILSILQVLEQQGYDVTVFWDKNLSSEIKSRLNLQFKNLIFKPNIFRFPSPFTKLQALSGFDTFFYVTDGSYFFSSAKNNYAFCMVPKRDLYLMSPANKIKTFNYRFISNSSYTQKWLDKWGVKSRVIYPYIMQDFLDSDLNVGKERIILTVGRFFPHLHAKKQDVVIDAFSLFRKRHPDFKLVMAGGLKEEDKEYFETLQEKANQTKNVILKPNIPYPELLDLYRRSMFFWHFTGYGVNESEHPDQVEHLGMTPLEAMAAGTVPFCYRAGGPKEVIQDRVNGFLFQTFEELLDKMEVSFDQKRYGEMQKKARQTVEEKFSYAVFKENVTRTLS